MTSDTPIKSLFDRMEEKFKELRADDATIRRCERQKAHHRNNVRKEMHLVRVAHVAMREHEIWLREEAAAAIREEAGVSTIPGFNSRRDNLEAFKVKMNAKEAREKEIVRAHLEAAAQKEP